ncbi:MAG: glycosyltransferase family 4 protein [Actinomycetota bacterium]|nr:glycosyltransferase family 4 protein [Actinomycetota bacterium]
MTARTTDARHVLIIIQNLPVPLDRRVWLECQALRDAGYEVSVVCPKGRADPSHEVIDGIDVRKYEPYPPTQRMVGFLVEHAYAFTMTLLLALKVWRRKRFHALQACNPSDIFWPLAWLFRLLRGTKFVFDQHDLCPELYESRFPEATRLPYWGLRALEWCTYRSADHVIATNDSYRRTALGRGGKRPDEVTVVRSAPDANRLRRGEPDPALRRGRRFLACYLGVMGPQDGVDIVLRAADFIVHDLGRKDISFMLIGTGDCFEELVALRDGLGLGPYVEFTGRAPDELVFKAFSTADVGLSPDPKNPLNDVSTMNKTMEYMAFELPVVAFDLRETRVSAGDAGAYVEPNDVKLYAQAIVDLLDDEPRRKSMGAIGRGRIEGELAWSRQRDAYVGVYDALLRGASKGADSSAARDALGRRI